MSDQSEEKPKIIVDDDWKSRAQAEKEELQQKQAEKEESDGGKQTDEVGDLPPASFVMLVSTLATQAMAALGRIPDPVEGKPITRLNIAKHHIDTLAILDEKTKGNLSDEEQEMLTGVLHQLRMDFISGGYKLPPPTSGENENVT